MAGTLVVALPAGCLPALWPQALCLCACLCPTPSLTCARPAVLTPALPCPGSRSSVPWARRAWCSPQPSCSFLRSAHARGCAAGRPGAPGPGSCLIVAASHGQPVSLDASSGRAPSLHLAQAGSWQRSRCLPLPWQSWGDLGGAATGPAHWCLGASWEPGEGQGGQVPVPSVAPEPRSQSWVWTRRLFAAGWPVVAGRSRGGRSFTLLCPLLSCGCHPCPRFPPLRMAGAAAQG